MANATSTQLQELYVAYFERPADPLGLDYWLGESVSQAHFASIMHAQPEFQDVFGSRSTESQVNEIYQNLFNREADAAGLTYWTNQINNDVLKLAEIATHLIWAAQNNPGSEADKAALIKRTNNAVTFTAEVRTSTECILAYQPGPAFAYGTDYLRSSPCDYGSCAIPAVPDYVFPQPVSICDYLTSL